MPLNKIHLATIGVALVAVVYLLFFSNISALEYRSEAADLIRKFAPLPSLDTTDYDRRLLVLSHVPLSTTTSPSAQVASSTKGRLWPVKTAYPKIGAILPFKRIVAYYGNFYSNRMGILGEYPDDELVVKLNAEKQRWEAADPTTSVLPAIQYIATVAQATAGKEGKYILRMPDEHIDRAIALAAKVNGIVILDIQVGLSTLQRELPMLEKYLAMPQVHLALDPEFSMKSGDKPGSVIGTFDAADINYAATYLARLVNEHQLPPKVLVIHRFTQNMVTNYQNIRPLPEVQIIMDMDGWGTQAKKIGTYKRVITPEPVQFTGLKIFYKNDLKAPSTGLLTTQQVLELMPAPSYIQYQ
ncbi:MAG: hypothetical protein WC030_03180 [Candidatus Paceibacterota bacterium]